MPTEFYVPVEDIDLDAGKYTLKAKCNGDEIYTVSMRLIDSIPTNADSFGSGAVTLATSVSKKANITQEKHYRYLWFYIDTGTTINFTAQLELSNDAFGKVSVFNHGNTFSKPKITIWGKSGMKLYINGTQVLTINLGNEGYITIDSAQMNAYKGDTLMNRYIVGDYENIVLDVGTNEISWTGDLTDIKIEDYTRYI